jgi:ATP-dependent DNA helicase PIF1
MLKRMPAEKKRKNVLNKRNKDKKTPIVNETFTKNIVFKEVLTS